MPFNKLKKCFSPQGVTWSIYPDIIKELKLKGASRIIALIPRTAIGTLSFFPNVPIIRKSVHV